MPDPLSQSILCPVLIGRDAQVAALALLLGQARDPSGRGHGQIALICGEAGIGESRLAAETKIRAAAQGMAIRPLPSHSRCSPKSIRYALLYCHCDQSAATTFHNFQQGLL